MSTSITLLKARMPHDILNISLCNSHNKKFVYIFNHKEGRYMKERDRAHFFVALSIGSKILHRKKHWEFLRKSIIMRCNKFKEMFSEVNSKRIMNPTFPSMHLLDTSCDEYHMLQCVSSSSIK